MPIAGLDVGTTGCKCSVYREDGVLLAKAYREYPPVPGLAAGELDGEALRRCVWQVLREAAAAAPGIRAVGVTSFGEAFVLLDGADRPLLPVLLCSDPRGEAEAAWLARRLGSARIAEITGTPPGAAYSLPKLMWLRRHRPAEWARARRILLMQDYVVYLLTGMAQIDCSLASRTMALDVRSRQWSAPLLEAAEMDESLLSRPVPSGTPAGTLRPAAADALGLPPDTLVVSCCHDQVTAAVGAGVLEPGMALDGTGTVECLTPVFRTPPEGPAMAEGNYAVVPFALPDAYCTLAFSYAGGALLKWFRDGPGRHLAEEARRKGLDPYAYLDGLIPDGGPTGVLVLPYFSGAATPYMDSGARGAVLGLTLDTGPLELYRALMEGVTYELMLNFRRLTGAGIAMDRLWAAGGGANSALWLQMKADALGLPVHTLANPDAGTVGGVLLSAVALGDYADLRQAAASLVSSPRIFTPRPELHARYLECFDRYCRVYPAVRPLI